MPNGVRKGERRGGRKKGTPNKATQERVLLAKRVLEGQQNRPGRRLAREILDDFMHLFTGMAAIHQPVSPGTVPGSHQKPDEKKFLEFAQLAVSTAAQLAPYQSPRLKAVVVSQEAPIGGAIAQQTGQSAARKLTASEAYRMFRDSSTLIDIP